jgi:oligoendopeptidase F
VASTTLADAIRKETAAGKTAARDNYIKALSAGSSKPPIEILKGAGVDMTTSAPFTTAMKEMNDIMDQIEALLAKGK